MHAGRTIAVFGSSRCQADSQCYAEAHELAGCLRAQAMHSDVGRLRGQHGAVSQGAAEAGGRAVGVTCALFDRPPATRG